jgi:gliding motility-associated-like protein
MNKNCYGKMRFGFMLIASLFSYVVQSQVTPVASTYSTDKFRFTNPQPMGFTISDIDFFGNDNGVAVGVGNGNIAYTKDGGANWKYGHFSFSNAAGLTTSTSFQDVHFVSANVVYAVGTQGCMAKSVDGGATWSFVKSPLYSTAKNINSVWFLNENKGYIGGQNNNTPDLEPKLYVTNDGGNTWDSMAAPIGGKTRVGYVNNTAVGSFLWDVTAKGKEIQRIKFVNDNLGYVTGSGLGTFEPIPAVNSATCNPTGGNTSTGSHHASLLWKFENGILTDYSISKERLGYNGVFTNLPAACNYRYASNSVHTQTYRAMQILDDYTVLLISLNNNIVIKVNTAPGATTPNINAPGVNENGIYTLLNAPAPPVNNSSALGTPIPATPAYGFLNPINIVKAANGKLMTPVQVSVFMPQNKMMTSMDNGSTWSEERWLPTGRNYSEFGGSAIALLPSGKVVIGGTRGVMADSTSGSVWKSIYNTPVNGSFNKMDFANCANGMAAGGGYIARTNDGGKNWTEIVRQDFINLNININSAAYVSNDPTKAYFVTSIGTVYKSTDFNAATPTLDPSHALPGYQLYDVATSGKDSVWACGYTTSPFTAQKSVVVRSFDGGTSWTTVNAFPTNPSATSYLLRHIEFPTNQIGYVAGTRDTVWKTTDGGVSWNKLTLPTPGVTPQITYNDMFALDANTVFLVGNGFPRKAVFRTTDGGTSWQDITGNILSIYPVGNFNSVLFHDQNNGYVGCAGGALLSTTNGGTTWKLEYAPSFTQGFGGISNMAAMSFPSKKVPAGTSVENRRLLIANNFNPDIFEYGETAKINVSSTEQLASSCSNIANGTVTVTATGGIAPYTYSIDGGAVQTNGVFSNVSAGNHTITINDFACGTITKTINVPVRPAPVVNAGPDKTIVAGDAVQLQGSSNGNPTTIQWTPNTSILSGANTFTPNVKPQNTTVYNMSVLDANGCLSNDNALVTVIPYCIKVMSAFTPNGDGQNDRWLVTNGAACTKRIAVAVFNRYGNVVYKNDNYNNDWTGTYNGKPVADGTYYYVITYTTITDNTIFLKGDVTILR